ncbi:glycosyltransferase [Propionibacterium freudenreichii]|uniref:glycosyltransferase n=1 Tax=Propionibacterium freudenreichii TaxID=1744 RepID=UPI00254B72D1|nr:glycosyltransferase [Propionibacterium freudenreichii]MDK9624824.1 glycosyltransferase [Propionibacterium freudenreichii]
MSEPGEISRVHTVSVVIPVYKGERVLPHLLAEIEPLTAVTHTPDGNSFRVDLVYPVWDNGPDRSDLTIHQLAKTYDFVQPVWLSRNYGQHPATMAGMASTAGDWIVTMDEDGQHDPADIGMMLDTALRESATVVYAKPTNPPPHGHFRNWASRTAKIFLSRAMGSKTAPEFNSFRLVLGETGRALAAYAGPGVYLDVALGWIARRVTTCPLAMRHEERPSSYSLKTLVSHFGRMIVTSGTRGLRAVTITGFLVALIGIVFAASIAISALAGRTEVQGWASTMCVILISTGLILGALGIIAEYIGVTVNVAMGKPLYLIVSDPADGPLSQQGAEPGAPAHDEDPAAPDATRLTEKPRDGGA